MKSLSEWLKVHGLERFTEIFARNEVDLTTLRILTDGDLRARVAVRPAQTNPQFGE